jgi:hypothetical protein
VSKVPSRAWLIGGAAVALLVGGAGLVRAQQGDPTGAALSSASPPPEHAPEEPPPSQQALSGAHLRPTAPTEAADATAEPDSAARSKPSPAKPVDPMKRPRYAVAIIQALDKVTAETVRFEAPVGRPIRYKTLIFTVHACETTAPDEDSSDAAAHVEIDSQPNGPDGRPMPSARQVFKGWMFANSPGLNLFQHPVYDAWLIACKAAPPPA